jgi:MYXO-CTERM domain-containing protein
MQVPASKLSSCCALICLLLAAVASARAAMVPIDPEILFGSAEGDAIDITTGTVPVTLSPTGGGIFSFHNATGGPLSQLTVDVQFPMPNLQGLAFEGTIGGNTGPHQVTSFSVFPQNQTICGDGFSATQSCVEMIFSLTPGPLVDTDQNFVLDFDKKVNGAYVGIDADVLAGTYTDSTDTSPDRAGDWPSRATVGVVPTGATPEPGYYGVLALLLGGGVFSLRRRRHLQ